MENRKNCTSSTQICKKREDIERSGSMSFFEKIHRDRKNRNKVTNFYCIHPKFIFTGEYLVTKVSEEYKLIGISFLK
ncbi:hypothetical protein FTO65_30030 [Bacillus cereus]|nr:hypothetical protein [Bacillus cereus]